MKVRQDLIEIFSTFAQFADDRFSHWSIDPRLQRDMRFALRQYEPNPAEASWSQPTEGFWALHWYRCWQAQPQSLAIEHLSAYLQEACYWVSRRMTSHPGAYPLPDCFQMAISALPKVLKGYRPDQGASLKTYATLGFNSFIRDTLRQQQAASSRTDWGLLRKVSQKCLTEALQAAGLSTETIDRYRLAWTCFKTLYAPTPAAATRQLAPPDAKTWKAIAQLYNHQHDHQHDHQRSPEASSTADLAAVSEANLERWLKDAAKRVRAYLSPQTTSLNIRKFEEGSGELQDDLPGSSEHEPMAALVAQEEIQERQAQKSQVSQVLTTALDQLAPQVQTLLALYYRQGLTQQQIAQQLDMKQYTISRRLSSTKETLLLAIAQWSQETLHISLTSPVVQQMSLVLEEWLQTHYQPEPLAEEEGTL
ncbi:MAG TPA: sigma-70 family RNA polymerase sigma factor [Coleofasciculaceae cyanobacterium]